MEIPFIIFAVIGVVVLIVVLSQASAKKANEAWQAAAAKLGLQFVPGSLFQVRRIEGQYRSQWVQVDTYTRSSGKNSKTFTRYEVSFPEDLGLGLRLSGQGFFSQVWTFLGGQDIHTGDAAFDQDIVVKGSDTEQVRRFLTDGRRRQIMNLMHQLRGCTIDDSKIHWSTGGVEKNAQNIFRTVDLMVDLARDLYFQWDEKEAPIEKSLEEIPHVIPVEPVYATPPPLPVQEASSTPSDQAVPWPPTYALPTEAENEPALAELADESLPDLPPDAVVSSPAEIKEEKKEEQPPPAVRIEAIAEEESARPADARTDGDLSTAAVCQALFHSDLMTHKVAERFEESFKDKQIQWTGELEFASGYSYDMEFGNEPGTKATIEVYEIKETYGSNKVQAVVQFPADMQKELRERQGGEISFAGKLIACDAYMRRLFVADGRVC